MQDPRWRSLTDAAKELILKLLQPDPKNRFTAKQALNHRWIKGAREDSILDGSVMDGWADHLQMLHPGYMGSPSPCAPPCRHAFCLHLAVPPLVPCCVVQQPIPLHPRDGHASRVCSRRRQLCRVAPVWQRARRRWGPRERPAAAAIAPQQLWHDPLIRQAPRHTRLAARRAHHRARTVPPDSPRRWPAHADARHAERHAAGRRGEPEPPLLVER